MKILLKLSGPSSGRSGDSLKILPRRDYLLSIFHEDITDELLFRRVEALRVTHYRACDSEMVAAYDRLFNVGESIWLGEIRMLLEQAGEPLERLQHLRIYLDDGPCYEFICHGSEFNAINTA